MLQAGDIVEGRYRIISVLSEGGMGTVYLAEHVLIQRRVALKLLHEELVTDANIVEHFMNEARAAGTLGHPNIVESTDMGFTRNDIPYIVFEYLEGSSLHDEIYRIGGLPFRRAIRIAHQIASALDASHNAGIIHRDLKSENIFLTDRADVSDHTKVLDFGISRFLGLEMNKSRPSIVMGTPEFMAPEQVTSPDLIDKRTDIYALGVILYEMLAARRPFHAQCDPHSVLHQVVHDPPPPLAVPNLPPGLQEMIISKLLAKEPEKRYQSMKDVQGALEAFHLITRPANSITPLSIPIVQVPVEATVEPTPAPAPGPSPASLNEPLPPARRGRRTVGWLAAAVVLAVAGGGLMLTDTRTPAAAAGPNPNVAALHGEAERLASTLDDEVRAAQLRAAAIATTPMLRAAIETDAATLRDMAREDFLFTPKNGEVLEIFQLHEPENISMLRIPSTATAIPPIAAGLTRVAPQGDKITVVVAVPIAKQTSGVGGVVALAVALDLTATRHRIADLAPEARLVGLDAPVVLAGTGTAAGGSALTIPVATSHEWSLPRPLALEAVLAPVPLPTAPAASDPWFVARFVLWGLAGALFVIYLLALLRGRTRG